MSAVSVTAKGQVTIPIEVRRALGIGPGTQVTFTVRNGIAQLEVTKGPSRTGLAEGAGMLTVRGKARSLITFDAVTLLKRGK